MLLLKSIRTISWPGGKSSSRKGHIEPLLININLGNSESDESEYAQVTYLGMCIEGLKKVQIEKWLLRQLAILFLLMAIFIQPNQAFSEESNPGEVLFMQHCSGCHVNGGNIIRRSKTLKIKALKKHGLDNQGAIAKVASEGIGTMSGYKEVLGEGGDQLVASWVWDQAQKAWVQG